MSPRAFTPHETGRIRARLHDAARDAFARRGLKGTTVDELARAAGISKGAFYRFYDGKESLLVALLAEYETGLQARLEEAVAADPAGGLDLLVDAALDAVTANPLIPVLMSPEGLTALTSRPEDEQRELQDRDARMVARITQALRDGGVTQVPPEPVLLGLLRSLVFVGLHRDEVGPELVEEVRSWLKATLRAAVTADVR
jgi:AcrR family transcriptional regulator